jgi:hypothetical protein
MSTKKQKMPVSPRALYQRINRKLRPQGQLLKKPRRQDPDIGDYCIVDIYRNILLLKRVDLEAKARQLGVMAEWEAVVPTAGEGN